MSQATPIVSRPSIAGDAEEPVVQVRSVGRRLGLEAVAQVLDRLGGATCRGQPHRDDADRTDCEGHVHQAATSAPDGKGIRQPVGQPAERSRHDDERDQRPGESLSFPGRGSHGWILGRERILARRDGDGDGRLRERVRPVTKRRRTRRGSRAMVAARANPGPIHEPRENVKYRAVTSTGAVAAATAA